MKIKIGFILSSPFLPYMKGIEPELEPYCDIVFLVAEENKDAYSLYDAHVNDVDCFILSGKMLYYSLMTSRSDLIKPAYGLDDQKGDLKDVLVKLLFSRRDMDFSRVFVDFATEQNDFLGLRELIPPAQWPYFGLYSEKSFENVEDIEHYCLELTQRHIELHRSGKIDLSLTRFGLAAKELEANGVPYIYVYPSKEYTVNFFLQIANAFNSRKTQDNTLGCMAIDLEGEPQAGELLPALNDLLSAYVRKYAYDITLQQDGRKIIIFTRYRDLSRMTLGLGTGSNFYQAKLNAIKAAEISGSRSGAVFYINEADIVVGPLSPKGKAELHGVPSKELLDWSRKLSVDHLNLQKIIAYTKIKQSTRISAFELAGFLNITMRSASRLLNKLEEGGGAQSYSENLKGGRGRPKKYYDIRNPAFR
jgi:hypothetical protein